MNTLFLLANIWGFPLETIMGATITSFKLEMMSTLPMTCWVTPESKTHVVFDGFFLMLVDNIFDLWFKS